MTEQVSKKQAVVVQGNELIVETSNSMKMNQLKILYFLMSCIEREDELFFLSRWTTRLCWPLSTTIPTRAAKKRT